MTKYVKKTGYDLQSRLAKVAFPADEKKLPKPVLNKVLDFHTPASFLEDILQYARGAESRGEWLFREKWLKPYMKKFVELNEQNSMWEDGMGNLVAHIGANPWDTLHVGHIDSVHSDDMSPLQHIKKEPRVMNKGKDNEFETTFWTLVPIPKHSDRVINEGTRWVKGVEQKHEYITYKLPVDKGRRCLGADDGCAVAIMLFLMCNQIEGTYVFTRGEERGCIGTHYMLDQGDLDFSTFKRAIEVDRKGTDEIICEMGVGITASREFTQALCEGLNMGHKPSDKGSITDVGHMAKLIPECVNLAAGYWKQHSDNEECLPTYLNILGERMKALDWSALPSAREAGVFRKPVAESTVEDFDDYYYYGRGRGYTPYSGTRAAGKGWKPKRGVNQTRTAWGDYTIDYLDKPIKLDEMFETDYPMDSWIRANINLVRNLLINLDLTFEQMDMLADMGLEEDIKIFNPAPEEDEEEEVTETTEESKDSKVQEDTNGSSES